MAVESEDATVQPDEKPAGKKRMLLIAAVALGAVLLGGGAWYFMAGGSSPEAGASGEHADASHEQGPPLYLALEPPMIVNFLNPTLARYLQVSVEVQAHDTETLDAVRAHMPAIRNNLMLLFSSQRHEDLVTREGKEAMRHAALQEVQAIVSKAIGRPGVDEVYFTSLVMQ
jgi:flagellar FliL protein